MSTIELTSKLWNRVEDRGWVVTCEWPEDLTLTELRAAAAEDGDGVTVDGIPVDAPTFEHAPINMVLGDVPPNGEVGVVVTQPETHTCPEATGACPMCAVGVPRAEE
jgi:hypothetical protein